MNITYAKITKKGFNLDYEGSRKNQIASKLLFCKLISDKFFFLDFVVVHVNYEKLYSMHERVKVF